MPSPAISAPDDARAYERLIEPHRAGLRAHCYRMLGSAADADDALQDTLLRAWRGLPGLATRSALRPWLYTIATNVCLRTIERRPKPPPAPLGELSWLDPYPDDLLDGGQPQPEARYEQRESVELAFLAALQHLPGRQRAVLLLRDVLGFSPAEIAAALEATPPSVYSALRRARQAVEERLPERSQQATLSAIGDDRLRRIVDRYVDAWDRGDVPAIAALLTADASFSMPPRPSRYRGRAAVAAFLAAGPASRPGRWRRVPLRANGQVGFAVLGTETGAHHAIELLTLGGDGGIAAVTAFHGPHPFPSLRSADEP